MKSPITSEEMILQQEERTFIFRNRKFTIQYHYYLCEESGEEFISTELEELNLTQIYNQA